MYFFYSFFNAFYKKELFENKNQKVLKKRVQEGRMKKA
jgi:hypothetical protein